VAEEVWQRAYDEINEFERQLRDHGIVVIKFWLHIDADEQLRRFEERRDTPYKRWKLTDDDWRNREKRGSYEAAINDMLRRTSTKAAPWRLIPANNKSYARIAILDTVIKSLETALSKRPAR